MNPWAWLLAAAAVYLFTSVMVYALRHPELTETQRFFQLWEALTWR